MPLISSENAVLLGQLPQLYKARLIKRYKRFLVDVEMLTGPDKGALLTVHCANPGSMLGLIEEDAVIWVSKSDNPKRKLAYSLELVTVTAFGKPTLVGVNTHMANKIAQQALLGKVIPELSLYDKIESEVPYAEKSSIDFLLHHKAQLCYIEVKSVTLRREVQQKRAEFPDSQTKRGQKHLGDLIAMKQQGHRAVMLFIVQREDCDQFSPASDIDPIYAQLLHDAAGQGVEVYCWDCAVSTEEIRLRKAVPLLFDA